MQTPLLSLPFNKKLAYACGMLGWSIISNVMGVMLIYFYLPPSDAGLSVLVPQIVYLGVLNVISLLVASGRLFDAITDPLIAYLSDKSTNAKGRRIPFMKMGLLPSVFCSMLMFFPLRENEAWENVWWLFVIQLMFYFFLTLYIIPYNALLPELAPSTEDKVTLSTILSFAFVIGVIISSQTPAIADAVQYLVRIEKRGSAIQIAVVLLSLFAGICMAIPVFSIDEKKYCRERKAVSIAIIPALKQALKNKPFRFFIVADFMYFISLSIITAGLLYYVKVLANMQEAEGGKLMALMVGLSLLFYPFINRIARKFGKKKLVLFSFLMLSFLFVGIYFTGKIHLRSSLHIYLLFSLCSIPLTFLSILPPALLAEITEADYYKTGQAKEGIFYAVRYFFVKMGQTAGIMLFAVLLLFGKDPGNDYGLRLTGLVGAALCAIGFIVFLKFDESEVGAKV